MQGPLIAFICSWYFDVSSAVRPWCDNSTDVSDMVMLDLNQELRVLMAEDSLSSAPVMNLSNSVFFLQLDVSIVMELPRCA